MEKLKVFYILKNRDNEKIEEKEIKVNEITALLFDDIIDKGCTTLRRPNEDYGSFDSHLF